MDQSRIDEVTSVFDDNADDGQKVLDFLRNMRSLEKKKLQEMRAWWNKITLQKYIQKEMIHRGLRLKKIPTTVF